MSRKQNAITGDLWVCRTATRAAALQELFEVGEACIVQPDEVCVGFRPAKGHDAVVFYWQGEEKQMRYQAMLLAKTHPVYVCQIRDGKPPDAFSPLDEVWPDAMPTEREEAEESAPEAKREPAATTGGRSRRRQGKEGDDRQTKADVFRPTPDTSEPRRRGPAVRPRPDTSGPGRVGSAVSSPGHGQAERLIPLNESPSLPEFPLAALPECIAEHVEAIAKSTQTPPDLAALAHLAAYATAVQRKVRLHVQGDHYEALSLYTVVAMESGTRKDAVLGACVAPLQEFQGILRQEARKKEKATARKRAELKEKLAAMVKQASQEEDGDRGEESEKRMQAVEGELASLDAEPSLPQKLLVADATPEALVSSLVRNGGRLAVFYTEAAVFEALTGRRYGGKGSGGDNDYVLLQAYSGSPIDVTRKDREEHIDRPALTLCLAVQPYAFEELFNDEHRQAVGLMARFLMARPPNRMGSRTAAGVPVDPSLTERHREAIKALLAKSVELGDEIPATMSLSEGALRRFVEFFDYVEPRRNPVGGQFSGMLEWAAKVEGNVARVAALLQVAEQADKPAPWDEPVSEENMERAIAIGHYLIAHASFFHTACNGSRQGAKWLWGRLCGERGEGPDEGEETELTKTQIAALARGHFKERKDLEKALAVLCLHGYLRARPGARPQGTSNRGRHPAPIYTMSRQALRLRE